MGRFAIGAWVALLWQHNANPSYKLASIPRYDDIVRTDGWAGSAHGPATGRRRRTFSTLLQQSGMRASTGGVLATKSERKMFASTCLYSLYAWFYLYSNFLKSTLVGEIMTRTCYIVAEKRYAIRFVTVLTVYYSLCFVLFFASAVFMLLHFFVFDATRQTDTHLMASFKKQPG